MLKYDKIKLKVLNKRGVKMTIDELKNRLTDEFQDIYKCILINGDWGIGKSYFLEEDYLKGKDYVKLSLFGLNNIEEVKSEIYAQLNKFLNFIKNGLINKLSGNNINILGGIASISIPYFKNDIQSAIKRKCKKGDLIIVFDDLERKSTNINMEDILGIIESISTIENINIIIVANEKKITQEHDKTIFENFKEKVIQKTYNVDKYSNSAPIEVIKKNLNNSNICNEKRKLIQSTILKAFTEHQTNNLRTLEKSCNFLKLVIKHINLKQLNEIEIKEIVIASLAVVIENVEKLYISIEMQRKEQEKKKQSENSAYQIIGNIIEDAGNNLTYCIIKNYFKEPFFCSKKNILIDAILEIYNDINVVDNFEVINKFYRDSHTMENEVDKKNTFYLSEEQLKDRINYFYNNYILKIDYSLDIYNWFKQLNEIYHYSTVIGMQKIFDDEKIFEAMDLYLEKLQTDKALFYVLNKHILYEIEEEKIKDYNKKLNEKIAEKYYCKIIDEITSNINKGKYNSSKIEALFTIFKEDIIVFNKKKIIDAMKQEKYFIPNLNFEISEEKWTFAHTIWQEARNYKEYRDKTFEECIKEVLKNATALGKYRIESLNKQYGISLE